MDIFVSWSGDRSRAVAELLVDWVKCVLQSTRPWISTRDIDKGSLWFNEISTKLQATAAGIICLTQENKENPWILFESGALAKGMAASRICTFLVDLEPADIRDPLAQFNHTTPDYAGLYNLAKTLNRSLGEFSLDENILKRVFDAYWQQFESDFNAVLENYPLREKPEPRSQKDMLSEILETTRGLSSRLRSVESKVATQRKKNGVNESHIFDFDKFRKYSLAHGDNYSDELYNIVTNMDISSSEKAAMLSSNIKKFIDGNEE